MSTAISQTAQAPPNTIDKAACSSINEMVATVGVVVVSGHTGGVTWPLYRRAASRSRTLQ